MLMWGLGLLTVLALILGPDWYRSRQLKRMTMPRWHGVERRQIEIARERQ